MRYSLFKTKLKYENIKIIEDFDPSLPFVEIDKNLMIQVFENLILNALNHLNQMISLMLESQQNLTTVIL